MTADGEAGTDQGRPFELDDLDDLVKPFSLPALPTAADLVGWLADATRQVERVATVQEFNPQPLRVGQLAALVVNVGHMLAALRRVVGGIEHDAQSWASLPADLTGALVWTGAQPGGTWQAIDVAEPAAVIRADLVEALQAWFVEVCSDLEVGAAHVADLVALLAVVGHRQPPPPAAVEAGEGSA